MQRVKTLVEKINEQVNNNESKQVLLRTTQMLYNEILALAEVDDASLPGGMDVQFAAKVPEVKEVDTAVENIEIAPPTVEQLEEAIEKEKEEKEEENKTDEPVREEATGGKAKEEEKEVVEEAAVSKEEVEPQATEEQQENLEAVPTEEKEPETENEEKVFETLEIDEADIAAELEEIKRNADMLNNMTANARPPIFFEEEHIAPTLAQHQPQPSANSAGMMSGAGGSLNDRLKEARTEVGEVVNKEPIKDLRKGVDLNDRYVFIQELFRGDEAMFDRSLKTINDFSIFPEAEYWIRRELKLKLGWDEKSDAVKRFDHLVRRRFSAI